MLKIAKIMCELLLEKGFIVQRYDSVTTNSIYLKLDYGMCNSIRISDHKGKKHLSYMYNLRSDIKKYFKESSPYHRYYYPFEKRRNLINQICYNRENKIKHYGIQGYQEQMSIQKNLNKNNKGFWQHAYLVEKEI